MNHAWHAGDIRLLKVWCIFTKVTPYHHCCFIAFTNWQVIFHHYQLIRTLVFLKALLDKIHCITTTISYVTFERLHLKNATDGKRAIIIIINNQNLVHVIFLFLDTWNETAFFLLNDITYSLLQSFILFALKARFIQKFPTNRVALVFRYED